MTTPSALLDHAVAPVPRHRLICNTCGDLITTIGHACHNCVTVLETFGVPPVPVEPICLYDRSAPIRDLLVNYKNLDHPNRGAYTRQLINLLASWTQHNQHRLNTYGPIEGCVVVPSTTRRQSTLDDALCETPIDGFGEPLQALQPTKQKVRGQPDPQLFTATTSLAGKRIVLIDDVYTTGATAQSAAHTLEKGYATVAFILVIGRRINPVSIVNNYGIEHPAYTQPTKEQT